MNEIVSIAHRTFEGLLTAWAAVTITFFALRLGSGDPTASLLSQGLATPEQVDALRHSLGLDTSLLSQYSSFLIGLISGDLGHSLYTGRPVFRTISEQLTPTLELALFSLAIMLLIGLALGVLAAWDENRPIGRIAAYLSDLATSLPVAFTGILAIYALSLVLQSLSGNLFLLRLKHLFLPALVLGFALSGGLARIIRTSLLQTLQQPYILAAKARGLGRGFRLLWHALRPALPPAVSLTALEAAFLFSGTVIIETVFSRPGLGRLLVSSILHADYPITQGLVALSALFYTASQVFADITALLIDPRLRREE